MGLKRWLTLRKLTSASERQLILAIRQLQDDNSAEVFAGLAVCLRRRESTSVRMTAAHELARRGATELPDDTFWDDTAKQSLRSVIIEALLEETEDAILAIEVGLLCGSSWFSWLNPWAEIDRETDLNLLERIQQFGANEVSCCANDRIEQIHKILAKKEALRQEAVERQRQDYEQRHSEPIRLRPTPYQIQERLERFQSTCDHRWEQHWQRPLVDMYCPLCGKIRERTSKEMGYSTCPQCNRETVRAANYEHSESEGPMACYCTYCGWSRSK